MPVIQILQEKLFMRSEKALKILSLKLQHYPVDGRGY